MAFIYREEYYNPNSNRTNITDIMIKKHRNGPVGNIELYFDRNQQRLRDIIDTGMAHKVRCFGIL